MKSSHGLNMYEFKVLVMPNPVSDKVGSIIIPDEHKDRLQYSITEGTIVAMSPLAFTYEVWPEDVLLPKVGDSVVYPKYAGSDVEGADGKTYRVIADKEVLAGRV